MLARLYGAPTDGHSYDYLERFAEQDDAGDVHHLCLSVLGEVEAGLARLLAVGESG